MLHIHTHYLFQALSKKMSCKFLIVPQYASHSVKLGQLKKPFWKQINKWVDIEVLQFSLTLRLRFSLENIFQVLVVYDLES